GTNPVGEGSTSPTDPQDTPTILQSSSSQLLKTQKPRNPKRKNTQVPQSSGYTKHVADETIYKELDDRLVRAATTNSSLEVEQDSGTKKPRGIQLLNLGLRMCLNFLMIHYSQEVLDLEKTNTTQALEITSLKRRVKKLEKKKKSRTHKLKRLYKTARVNSSDDDQSLGEDASKQGRIKAIDADENITLVNDQNDAEMFNVNDLHGEELIVDAAQVNAAGEVNATSIATTDSVAATITTDDITLAKALVEIKTSKPKAKVIILQEPSESTTT
nr:hypothetical protein [Tanacetum cinerariifolium]